MPSTPNWPRWGSTRSPTSTTTPSACPTGTRPSWPTTPRTINVNGTPTTYNGDMVLVLDQNFQVAWVWDAFDWLDTNRLATRWRGPERLAARQRHRLVARRRGPVGLPALPGLGDQDRLRQRDRRRPRRLAAGAGRRFHHQFPRTPTRGSPTSTTRAISTTRRSCSSMTGTPATIRPRTRIAAGRSWSSTRQTMHGDAGGQCRPGQLLRRPGGRAEAPQREPRLHVRDVVTGSRSRCSPTAPRLMCNR